VLPDKEGRQGDKGGVFVSWRGGKKENAFSLGIKGRGRFGTLHGGKTPFARGKTVI